MMLSKFSGRKFIGLTLFVFFASTGSPTLHAQLKSCASVGGGLPPSNTYPPGMPWIDTTGPENKRYDIRNIPLECDPTRYNWNEQFWETRTGAPEQMPRINRVRELPAIVT